MNRWEGGLPSWKSVVPEKEGALGPLSTSTEPPHHWVAPTREAIEQNVQLYQLTYDEAQRTLDDQAAEVNGARTRAVQFLAFVGSASAFLVGTTIHSAPRHSAFYTFAISASVFALIALIAVAALLNPRTTPLFHRVQPRVLLENWIEREVPAPSKAEMLRELSLHYEDWREQNELRLARVRQLYFGSIVLGALQLAAWATLAWIAG